MANEVLPWRLEYKSLLLVIVQELKIEHQVSKSQTNQAQLEPDARTCHSSLANNTF